MKSSFLALISYVFIRLLNLIKEEDDAFILFIYCATKVYSRNS